MGYGKSIVSKNRQSKNELARKIRQGLASGKKPVYISQDEAKKFIDRTKKEKKGAKLK